jgi:photosystem II stability/assembly factor-like uncharacterized protein
LTPTRIYAAIEVGGMLLSDDGGRNWQPANNGLTDMDVHDVHACEKSPGTVYAACGEKSFRSLDRAAHWEEITPKSHDYGMSVIEDAAGVVYLGSAKGRPNTWIREEGAKAAIFRTTDAGCRWETVLEGLYGGVMNMCLSPDGNGIFAGLSDGTLYAIDDSGARVVASGLPGILAVKPGA